MRVDGVDFCEVCYNPVDECTCDPEEDMDLATQQLLDQQFDEELWDAESEENSRRIEDAFSDAIFFDGEDDWPDNDDYFEDLSHNEEDFDL